MSLLKNDISFLKISTFTDYKKEQLTVTTKKKNEQRQNINIGIYNDT